MSWRTAQYVLEEDEQTRITVTDADCEFPIETDLPIDPSPFIANGTLTPDAWQSHLAGQPWQIYCTALESDGRVSC